MSDDKIKGITKSLGNAYANWKASEKHKDQIRKEFFSLASEAVSKQTAIETVKVYGPEVHDALARLNEQYPTWRPTEVKISEPKGYYEYVIQEDPDFKAYTYVNPDDGMVYTRQVQAGSINLDEERLERENPELFDAVTYVPQERQLRPLDELEPEELAELQDYLYAGKPRVKLAPPRKAKPEEL